VPLLDELVLVGSVQRMQQLVLQFPADAIDDYDAMVELEDLLIETLNDGSDVDGHDFGNGEMNIFVWTDDAERTFATVREILLDHALMRTLAAGYREEHANGYTPLWPAGSQRFEVS
jgi:hypothetical protein